MTRKKLDTIHIHGLNIIIIFGLIVLFIFDNKAKFASPILALSTTEDSKVYAGDQYNKLNQSIIESGDINKIKLKVDEKKLKNSIIGLSAIIYDANNNTSLWSYNANKTWSLASMTKVMTAYVYKKYCDKSIKYGGLSWHSDDALRFMLIESSNGMSSSLASNCMQYKDFVNKMNEEAILLNLNLHYTNSSGIDTPGAIGGRGDATSIASFFAMSTMKYPEIFDSTTHSASLVPVTNYKGKTTVKAINTNQDIMYTNGARMSKTGLTNYAGGNLGIVYDIYIGRPLVLIVLGSTKEGRFQDIELLKDSIYTEY